MGEGVEVLGIMILMGQEEVGPLEEEEEEETVELLILGGPLFLDREIMEELDGMGYTPLEEEGELTNLVLLEQELLPQEEEVMVKLALSLVL